MRRNSDDNAPDLPLLKLLDCSLRISVIPLSVATIWFIVTNHEEEATVQQLLGPQVRMISWYMASISVIASVNAFVAAMSTWIRCLVSKAWLFFVSDQVVAYLMVTSAAAVMELLFLAYQGDKAVSWSEACATYGKFCSRMKLALVFHSLALCDFLVLAVISAHRVFSMFEPPSVSRKEVELEDRTT